MGDKYEYMALANLSG